MIGIIILIAILTYVLLRVYMKNGRLFVPTFSNSALCYAQEHNLTENELITTIKEHPELFRTMPPPQHL